MTDGDDVVEHFSVFVPGFPLGGIGEVYADDIDSGLLDLLEDVPDLGDVPIVMRGIPIVLNQECASGVIPAATDQQVAHRHRARSLMAT